MTARIARVFRLGILAAAFPAALAAQGIRPHAPVPTTREDIARARDAYVDAYNAKNAAGVDRMYTIDAVVIGTDGSEATGPAIARRDAGAAPAWDAVTVESTSLKIYGATALDVGTWTTHPSAGDPVVRHYMAVFRHGIHGWKLQAMALAGSQR